ncbi:MAG: thioredoxin family protein [Dehalococcoidia bacterium]
MAKRQEATGDAVERLVESERPVLVMFWQPRCGPCHAMAPVFDRLAREYKGRLGFSAVNVVQQPQMAAAFGVRATPTMALVQKRRLLRRYSGIVPEETLRSSLERYALSQPVALQDDEEEAPRSFLGRVWRFLFGGGEEAAEEEPYE